MTITKVTAGLISAEASAIDLNIDANTLYIDASENRVGIGLTSPATKLHVSAESTNANTIVRLQQGTTAGNYSAIEVGRTDGSGNVHLTSAVTGGIPIGGIPGILLGSENTSIPAVAIQTPNSSNGHIVFNPKGTEKVRIDSSGNLLVGGTSVNAAGAFTLRPNLSNGSAQIQINRANTTATSIPLALYNNSVFVGGISYTDTATSFLTSSDARLKDVTGTARGLEVINELNPVAYNWKADGKADEGLIAQEVKELVPNAVVGSEAEMYSMDYSKLVVHLVAGMQEQQAIIEDLQTQLNKLKR